MPSGGPAHCNVIVYDSPFNPFTPRYWEDKNANSKMKELIATNNLVTISYVEALLNDAGIDYSILDQNMSILEGSIGIIPRRLMVVETVWYKASKILEAAGLEDEISSR